MDENAATDEDRRVIALADELRISSDICPRELLSLRTTTPLESNDELDEEEGREEEGDETSSRGEDISGNEGLLRRYVAGSFLLKMYLRWKWRERSSAELMLHCYDSWLPSQLQTPKAPAIAPWGYFIGH